MSQVKNLRAMFENKGDTSPPDRGRSSVVSSPQRPLEGTSSGGSPRPLSKVRTNFVAVEKDGRMGLRKDHSVESSLSRRRMSTETADTEPHSISLERSNTRSSEDAIKAPRRFWPNKTFPESPNVEKAVENSNNPQIIMNNGGNDVSSAVEQERTISLKAGEAEPPSVSDNHETRKIDGDSHVSLSPSKLTTTRTRTSTVATRATKMRPKEPIRGQKEFHLESGPRNELSRGSVYSKKVSTSAMGKNDSPGTARKALPLAATSHGRSSFVKPAPKTPTQPTHLPLSLTAPTASSGSKVNVPHRSLSRQSGTCNNVTTPPKTSTARTNASNIHASAIRAKPNISRSRPSLGPPPSKQTHAAASNKKQTNVDEGFLARMMRPTQSSSSKATDKTPNIQPKKVTQRTVPGENSRRPGPGRSASLQPGEARSNKSLGMRPIQSESIAQNNNGSKAVPPAENQEQTGVAGDEFSLSSVSPSPDEIREVSEIRSATGVALEVDTEESKIRSLNLEAVEKSHECELSDIEQVSNNAIVKAAEFEAVDPQGLGPSNGKSTSTGLMPATVMAREGLYDTSQESEVTRKDDLSTEEWPATLPEAEAKLVGTNTFDYTMHDEPASPNGSVEEGITDQPSTHEHGVSPCRPMTATKQAEFVTSGTKSERKAPENTALEESIFSAESARMTDHKEAHVEESNEHMLDIDDDLSIQGIDLDHRTDSAAITELSKTLTSHPELSDHKPVENIVLSS